MPGAVVQEDTIFVEKGRSLHINIPFFGNPTPTAIWKYNDVPIPPSPRIRIDTLGNETSLNVKQMSAEDAGVYSLILENETGRLEAHINVKILGEKQTAEIFFIFTSLNKTKKVKFSLEFLSKIFVQNFDFFLDFLKFF